MIPGIDAKHLFDLKKEVSGYVRNVAVVRLYSGDEISGWRFEAMGCLFLVEDKKTEAPVIYLVDLKTHGVVWASELCKGCNFQRLTKFFFSFEGEYSMWGLSFADGCDAVSFYRKASGLISDFYRERNKKSEFVVKKKKKEKKEHRVSEKKKEKKDSGKRIFGGLLFKPKRKKAPKLVISQPNNFCRSMHIGLIPGRGFETENLPEEWKTVFRAAGITEDVYQNPENAAKIMKTLKNFKRKNKKKTLPQIPKKGKEEKKDEKNEDEEDDVPTPPKLSQDFEIHVKKEIRKKKKEVLVKFDPRKLSPNDRKGLMGMLKESILSRRKKMEFSDSDSDSEFSESDEEDTYENYCY